MKIAVAANHRTGWRPWDGGVPPVGPLTLARRPPKFLPFAGGLRTLRKNTAVTAVNSDFLTQRRDVLKASIERQLREIRAAGRDRLTEAENRRYQQSLAELRDLDSEISRIGQVNTTVGNLQRRIDANTSRKHTVNDSHLVYSKRGRQSWVRDLVLAHAHDDHESRSRLAAHAHEVATDGAYQEFRDLSRVDGAGGYAVPPAWMMAEYVELARPGRAFANLCQRMPLPGGTDQINIPKVLTGTAVGVQTADNTVVTDVDLTDTFISAPVRTISGQQGVAIQLIDQSPIAFDDIIFRDLIAAYAGTLDVQVMSGLGTSGQVLGVDYTPGISTIALSGAPSIQTLYSAIANAVQLIHHPVPAARGGRDAPEKVGLVPVAAGQCGPSAVHSTL